MRCPVCTTHELAVFHQGPSAPVFVNVLHDTPEAARSAPRASLRLGVCPGCGFVHNVDFDPSLLDYAPGYENSLHGSPTFHAWAKETARALVRRHGALGRRAVDVGGGRGEFMTLLLEAGLGRGLVVDPSAPDDVCIGETAGLDVQRRTFADGDVDDGTSLVLARHVLEHLAKPLTLAEAIATSARRVGSGVYIEVPNGRFNLSEHGLWDLIYEHCSYFTPSALRELAVRAGLSSFEVREEFHGQFLVAESAPTRRPRALPPGESADAVCGACERFARLSRNVTAAWCRALERREWQGLALWGAGAKGANFLNTVAGAELVLCAVDVNRLKHGKFVAGTGHPIISPAALRDREVEVLIVLNPAYTSEIRHMLDGLGVEAEVMTTDVALAESSG